MEFWQILTNLLMVMLSFKWGYTEGKLKMIETMLGMTEKRRGNK